MILTLYSIPIISKKMKYYIFIITILFLTLSCTKESQKCNRDYLFEIAVEVTPQIDTFKIGDTILLQLQYKKQMIDIYTNDSLDIGVFNFGIECLLGKVENEIIDASSSFMWIDSIGISNELAFTTVNARLLNFDFDNNTFQYNSKLVPQQAGVYYFVFTSNYHLLVNSSDSFSKEVNFQNLDCTENANIICTLKNNESDNFHFYGTTVTEELYNLQEEGFKQEGGYAFVVTE